MQPANTSAGDYYSYVLVRRDIPLPDQLVQVGHACMDAGKKFQQPDGCNLVLLETPDQDTLELAVYLTESRGVRWSVFYEPDDDMGYTAACSEPIREPRLRKLFRNYKLWQ